MEQQTYLTAPSSPIAYVTAPTSPVADLDDFQFATSSSFSGLQLHQDDVDHPVGDGGQGQHRPRHSLPSMAFADELFVDGLVMPLKLPPRLQCDTPELNQPRSPALSPRTIWRVSFARWSSRNDDFDPFLAALEMVREESRGRNSRQHRRSRSYSPFRGMATCRSDDSASCHNNVSLSNEVDARKDAVKALTPSHSGPLHFKGSAYARWVRHQKREGMSPESPRGYKKRVRPVKDQAHSPDKPTSPEVSRISKQSKVWKLKGLLLRYASFKRGNHGIKGSKTSTSSEASKSNYFSRMSFKNKGSEVRQRMPDDAKNMAVVQYKPSSFSFCLGRGLSSP